MRTTHDRPALSEAEISRRLMRVYELAIAASKREEYFFDLHTSEVREARRLLMELCGAELRPVKEPEQ